MKSYISVCTAILLSSAVYSQRPNLVPNPGFEDLRAIPCEPMYGELSQVIKFWQQGSKGSADIMSMRASETCYSNPNSSDQVRIGFEKPHGGDNMGLIMTSAHNDYREYLGCNLTEPTIVGRNYYVEAYVSLADYSGFATNNIGFLFRTGMYQISSGYQIFETPQVNCTEVITTDSGWVKISGNFTADKVYTHFMIGNFLPEQEITKQKNFGAGSNVQYAEHSAYYLDDVSVRRVSDLEVTGDSMIVAGKTATVVASGGNTTYTWADIKNPGIVLGSGPTLTMKLDKKTTFRVTCGNEYADVTVNVRKQVLQYITDLRGRKVNRGRTITVHSDEVVISVYDKFTVDGDSISLYYGDSLIVQHLVLQKEYQSFTLKLDFENPKQIILYAENLGSSPPNTAAIVIRSGKDLTDIILESDLVSCDSFMLIYKPRE